MNGRINFLINTGGAAGTMPVDIPDNFRFVTVLNTSGYTFNFFEGAAVDLTNFLCTAGARDYVCLPLMIKNPMVRTPVLIQWTGAATTDTIQVIFSQEMILIGNGPNGGVIDANQGSPAVIGNAWPVYISQGGAVLAIGNPIFAEISKGGAVNAVANPFFVELSDGAAAVGTLANQLFTSLVPVGVQANAWNAAVVGAGGTSAVIDCRFNQRVSAFGNSNAATTINLQVSQDGVNFYTAGSQILAAPGDFHITVETGARYARLNSTGAATITATIAAK